MSRKLCALVSIAASIPIASATHAQNVTTDVGAASSATTTTDSAPRVVAERPFLHGARPHPDGAVQASVEDEALARWNVGGSSAKTCPSNRAGFHVAPRVKVDTEARSGRLSERFKKGVLSGPSVLAQTRNHGYWPFRLCFEAALRGTPTLAGKTRVRFVIGRNGHVAAARVLDTELTEREVATCLATRTRALTFTPTPKERAEIDMTVDLNPGDATLPDTCRAHSEADSSGTSIAPAAAAALEQTLPAVTACYRDGLARDPALWGRIAFEVDVAPSGAVRAVVEHDSHFPDPRVVTCGSEALRQATLPAPPTGAAHIVWGVRLGIAPFEEAASTPGNVRESTLSKSSVAESQSSRVPLGP